MNKKEIGLSRRTGYLIKSTVVGMCVLIGTTLSACGGDDDNSGLVAQIIEMFFTDDTIRVGEGTVLHVLFSYSSDRVFDENEMVSVVVRLPAETTFRNGTAEIQRPADDESVGAQIFDCPASGEQFLLFDLDENDLATAGNPDGDADAELTLTVDALLANPDARIQATARENGVPFACGEPFIADMEASLAIVP